MRLLQLGVEEVGQQSVLRRTKGGSAECLIPACDVGGFVGLCGCRFGKRSLRDMFWAEEAAPG